MMNHKARVAVAALVGLLASGCCCKPSAERPVLLPDDLPRITTGPGTSTTLHLLRYDKRGNASSPKASQRLIDEISSGAYTDVFVFSHGWNNTFDVAERRYVPFFNAFEQIRASHPIDRPYRPAFVGLLWPSTAMMSPEEEGPRIESAQPPTDESDAGRIVLRQEVADLAYALSPADATRAAVHRRAIDDAISRRDSARLAALLAPLLTDDDHPADRSATDELLERARAAQRASAADAGRSTAVPTTTIAPDQDPVSSDGGNVESTSRATDPESLEWLDPRWIVRVLSVTVMKDRAAAVGRNGVAELVGNLARAAAPSGARIHLIGHSYGGQVMLAAVSSESHSLGPDAVDSLLLLQPAVNANCFADGVPGVGRPGAYRRAPGRVRLPIYSTFSEHDVPLTTIYHLFLVRSRDRMEAQPAAAAPRRPPNNFAALGGFGPQPLPDAEGGDGPIAWIYLRDVGDRYAPAAETNEIIGLRNRGDQITGHSDIDNPFTRWALWNQLAAP